MFDLFKICALLLILLLLIKKKWDLGLVLLIGSLVTGLFFRLPLMTLAQNLLQVLVSGETITLVGVVLLVLYLGNVLHAKGNFKIMVNSLNKLIPEPRLILALPSAFIGLLPMLGGALMSAPVVNEAGKRWNLSPEWKTFLNYWFRHIWEYSWPLYVNVILASAILQIPIKKIAIFQLPFTILAAFLGLVILFRNVLRLPKEKSPQSHFKSLVQVASSVWPIILAILLIFSLKFSMVISLGVVAFLTQIFFSMKIKERMNIFIKSIPLKTVLLIISVMVFKRILEISGALNSITQLFHPEGISVYLLLFTIPFFLGLLTGVNHAYVGISFPILLPILGQQNPDMVMVMFAYVSGFVGILLSPAHLCLSLTVDYFKADLREVYKLLIWPTVTIFAMALLVVFFVKSRMIF